MDVAEADEGIRHGLTGGGRIVEGVVEPDPVILVIAAAQGAESLAEDVVDQGVTGLLAIRGAPPGGRGGEALGVGHHGLGLGVPVGAAFEREGVVVHREDEIGVEGEDAGQVVPELVRAVLQHRPWSVGEVEVVVIDHQQRGVVVAVVHRTAALHLDCAFEVGLGVGLVDGDLHRAGHAFGQGELVRRPPPAIHELRDGRLELLENRGLDVVDGRGDDADLAV